LHTIHSQHHHLRWDRAQPSVLTIGAGETVELDCLDASGGRIQRHSSAADIANLDPDRANPVTGPIYVDGAEPGDVLSVDILDFGLNDWGWTALIPGFGLLTEDFPEPYLCISTYTNAQVELAPGLTVPLRPFPGTIGVAPASGEPLPLIPPHAAGGNIDTRDLVAGARLLLPVQVPGALLSIGDTHAAQGDGEVCGTAVETALRVRVKIDVQKRHTIALPQVEVPAHAAARALPEVSAGFVTTTGIAADLVTAARDAVRAMIDRLGREHGMAPELAYCLCSVAGDLRVNEIVNAPHWVVGLRLPNGCLPE